MVEQISIHIRVEGTWVTFCGEHEGGSLSLFHYDNKKDHINSLVICKDCINELNKIRLIQRIRE